jgi:hypothetical protein
MVTKDSACINNIETALDIRYNILHKHSDPKSSAFKILSSKLEEFVEKADEVLRRKSEIKIRFLLLVQHYIYFHLYHIEPGLMNIIRC